MLEKLKNLEKLSKLNSHAAFSHTMKNESDTPPPHNGW